MDYEVFLQKLKNERKRQRISLRRMGDLIGTTGALISLWENNKVALKMKEYLAICEALKIDPAHLLEEKTTTKECRNIAEGLNALCERDKKIIKDLIILMRLPQADL